MTDIKILKNITIFKPFSIAELEKIAKIITLRKIKKGEFLFKQGDQRNEFFIIVSGQIKLAQSNTKNEEGWAILKRDDFICANALIDYKSFHHQAAIAVEDGEILAINGAGYKNLAKKNGSINNVVLSYLISGLNEHLRHSTNKLVTLYKTGQIASSQMNLEEAGKKILKSILQVIKAERAVFSIFDKYKKASVILATVGFSRGNEIKGKKIFLDNDEVMKEIFKTKEIYKSKPADNFLEVTYRVAQAIASPMIFDGQIIGMILLGDKISGKFSINNEILLRLITNQIAEVVYRSGKKEEQKAEEEMRRTYISH